MTETLINIIYGLGGVLMIICLLIWLKNINNLKKAVEKFESFTAEDDSPCEYPLDEKVKSESYTKQELDFKDKIKAKYYIKKRVLGTGEETFQVYRKHENEDRERHKVPHRPMTDPLKTLSEARNELDSIVNNGYLKSVIKTEVIE